MHNFSICVFQADAGSNIIPALQKWKMMDRNQDFKLDHQEIAYYLGKPSEANGPCLNLGCVLLALPSFRTKKKKCF